MQEKHKLYLGDTRKVVAEMVERCELSILRKPGNVIYQRKN